MSESREENPLENRPADRRGFFREGFAALLGPLAGLVEKRLEAIERAAGVPDEGPAPALLRPPGALPEAEFLEACDTCGKCVSVCPAQAIYLVPGPGGPADAKPVVNAATQPCVLCDSLACMSECPTGALVPTPREKIRMGLAVLNAEQCLRTGGEACTLCVDTCPIGLAALRLGHPPPDGEGLAPVVVDADGCTGCGVCEFHCPTDPRAIAVQPISSPQARPPIPDP